MSEMHPGMIPSPLVICHSHLRWDWVYQRPQHLLSRLARHAPVIVEEEPVFDDRPPGLDALHVADGVTVLRPHRPRRARTSTSAGLVEAYVAAGPRRPAAGPLVLLAHVRPLRRPPRARARSSSTTAWTSWPSSQDAPAGLIEAEDRLLARADVVFTGGRSLYEAKRGRNPNVHLLPLGRRGRPLRPRPRPRHCPSPTTWRACPGRSSATTASSTSGSTTT